MPRQHPAVSHGRIGVLLVNLGTPDATDAKLGAPLLEGVPARQTGHRGRYDYVRKFVLNAIILPRCGRDANKASITKNIWNLCATNRR